MTDRVVGLPDPARSRAVLLGVSRYESMDDLPAVDRNIAALQRLLTDPDKWGLDPAHCTSLVNPDSVHEVLDVVQSAAEEATDALVFYFAGHGLLDENSNLFLALPNVAPNRLYRAVRFDDIRREVITTARGCYGKVVILDCCFSGSAMRGAMGSEVELADHAQVDGTYLMTASSENSVAKAVPDAEYTAFTAALIDKIENGVADGPDLLDMETLFHHARVDLAASGMPTPQQRSRNDGRMIALSRNRRGRRSAVAGESKPRRRVLPEFPDGAGALARQTPSEVVVHVAELRATGRSDLADQVLMASAASRIDQEVAGIIDALSGQQHRSDLDVVVTAICLRSPGEVMAVVDALREIDLLGESRTLLARAATGDAADVAELAAALQTAGRVLELGQLLDVALGAAQERENLIDLISALWLAGLRQEVDDLISRALPRLAGPAVLTLAEQLRAVGSEPVAFGIYVAAAEAAAQQPPDTIAQLCRSMISAEQADKAERIAATAIAAVSDPRQASALATAFWTTDQPDFAARTLEHAATTLDINGVVALAADLRAQGRDDAEFSLCERVVTTRPADDICQLVTAVRSAGRPVTAKNLVVSATNHAQVDVVADFVLAAAARDQKQVLTALLDGTPHRLARMINDLAAAAPSEHLARSRSQAGFVDLLAVVAVGLGETPVDQVATFAALLREVPRQEFFRVLLRGWPSDVVAKLLQHLSRDDASLLFAMAVEIGQPVLGRVVDSVARGSASVRLDALLDNQPAHRFASLCRGLRAAGLSAHADRMMSRAATDVPARRVLATVTDLRRSGEGSEADTFLQLSLSSRTVRQLRELIQVLYLEGDEPGLGLALSWIREQRPADVNELADLLHHADLSQCARELRRGVDTDTPDAVKTRRFPWLRN
ncbi:caspase family protein [Lentzea sp. JNUCC 0626]|uniref:caspase, EACC1-associated type n=1 Tax=Lentzea sp. JNUCC 0626 TaxID=3367513 RepID=UPI00374992DC